MFINADTQFARPVKRIFDSQCTLDFQSSEAIVRLKYFLQKYAQLIHKVNVPHEPSRVPIVNQFVELLNHLSQLVDETPPLKGPRRYGNLACREWHAKLDDQLAEMWTRFLPLEHHNCIVELVYYMGNSFGSSTRLDYGTGHELSFLAVVGAVDMLGLWTQDFGGQDFLLIMNSYYAVVRKLILTYTLEPAGSHGVWGLDDHFHLAYVFGSAQWADYKEAPLKPQDILHKQLVEEYAPLNLYCQAINFIYRVKHGPFREHSSMLYDLATTVHSWSKLEKGLTKMYAVEVLKKFPVVQHFWFGTGFYPWVDQATGRQLPLYDPADAEKRNASSSPGATNYTSLLSSSPSANAPMHHFPTANQERIAASSPLSRASQMNTTAPTRTTPERTRMGPPTNKAFSSTLTHDFTKKR
ncbi:RRD1 (YIL153W) [Zygosaccharomyces parabailii]|nr:RRD1 (YIL153W) [Zygosaccharomyces parabailii]CDH17440.1 related to Serine/threonine-protein phosphatase 2A activator 1 [Zygosaccharomyces bailii ISA1307]